MAFVGGRIPGYQPKAECLKLDPSLKCVLEIRGGDLRGYVVYRGEQQIAWGWSPTTAWENAHAKLSYQPSGE